MSTNLSDEYTKETGKLAFTGSINLGTWEYNDGYIEWLEARITDPKPPNDMFTLKAMEPISSNLIDCYTPDPHGNYNPFNLDAYCMGQPLSKDIYLMFDFHNTEPFRYCYLINTKTLKRQQLTYNK